MTKTIIISLLAFFLPFWAIAAISGGGGVSEQNPGRVPSYISTGPTFSTTTGTSCGTVGSLTGGATAGTYVSGTSGTCTLVILMSATAPNGWSCRATDLTTSADASLQVQTASTATTATISGTTASADVVSFSCMGY